MNPLLKWAWVGLFLQAVVSAQALEVVLVSLDGRVRPAEVDVRNLEPDTLPAARTHSETARVRAEAQGGQIRAEVPQLTPPKAPEDIEHDLPLRWRIRLTPEQSIHQVRINASWSWPRGRPEDKGGPPPAPPGRVRVITSQPWLLSRDEDGEVWEGSVRVVFPGTILDRDGEISGHLRLEAYHQE